LDLAGPLGRGPVADADDLELLDEPVGHPDHHVVDQRPGQAVEGPVLPLVGRAGDDQLVALLGDGDVGYEVALEGALRALDGDVRAVERHVDAGRDGDRLPPDSGHGYVSSLPDMAQDLAADPALARLPVGEETLVGRKDGDAHAAEDPPDAVGLAVDPQAG